MTCGDHDCEEDFDALSDDLDHYINLLLDQYEKLNRVRDWADRHAEHAGRAPLIELREILDGIG